ncbi:MAG: TGS domain-containing protein [Candidatus Dojkabacteria bacterium]
MEVLIELENKLRNLVPAQHLDLVKKGIVYSSKQYEGIKRYNGDAMIVHALNIAIHLREMRMDISTTIAGLLHEVGLSEQNEKDIKEMFGESILRIIKEAKRIKSVTNAQDTEPEIIVKYILNSTKDLRPIILKIMDTKYDVDTIQNIPEEAKKETLNKALNIYSTLAEYLHLEDIKKEIDENAFKEYLPTEYESITKKLVELKIDKSLFNSYVKALQENTNLILPRPKVEGRIKSKYSIYNKLRKYEKEWINPKIDRLEDLIAFRLIFKNEESCYKGLEKIMDNAQINYDRFDDYISKPKKNKYMAMHFPVKFPEISDIYIELQILTDKMYYTNTYGEASHIAYKASKSRYMNSSFEYNWVEEIQRELEKSKKDSDKKIDIPIKINVFKEEVFAFTPKNKIIYLEKGDTVLDFAYRLHTDIGNSATGAKVNGAPTSLSSELKTGDIVEIKTDKNKSHQKEKALQFTNSESTKNKIKKYLSKSLKR